MKGDIYLNEKESRRVYVLEQLVAGKLTIKEAVKCLGLSERHIIRLKEGFKRNGAAFLAHKNRGRKPKHAFPDAIRHFVVQQAIGPLRNSSCQHMAELLAAHHGLQISAKTIGRILKEARIPLRFTHKASRRRRTRDRMPQLGLLVQMDASPYKWLEERGPTLHLHGAIDDATGALLGLHFRLQEDTIGYLQVLKQMLRHYGIPRTVYTDRHTLFFSPKRGKLSVHEELAGTTVPLTQFGRVLAQLGIQHIPAHSPQAKGRIERLWGTLQARLVTELRMAGIRTLEEANAFLETFRIRFNERFAIPATDPQTAFRPSPAERELHTVLALQTPRQASNGSTISYRGTVYRLLDRHGHVLALKPRTPVSVLTHLDGTMSALYQGKLYRLQPVPQPKKPADTAATVATGHTAPANTTRKPRPPAPDHPWRQYDRKTVSSGPGPIERFVDRLIGDDLDSAFWSEIYAQR